MLGAIIDVFVSAVVEVELCVDVFLQVLMSIVHPVVDHGDTDALTVYAIRPHGPEVDILSNRTAQMPLAYVQRIADLRVIESVSLSLAVVKKLSVFGIL